MSKTQHTPGPWSVERHTKPITGEPGNLFIHGANAMVQSPIADTSARANARLIAAAPDLLAACEALVAVCPTFAPTGSNLATIDAARAAIAKARGEA